MPDRSHLSSVSVRPTLVAIVCAGFSIAVAGGCGSQEAAPAKSEPPPLPSIDVETVRVETAVWATLIRTQGSLVADEVAVLGTRVEGLVDQVHVDLGDRVKAGQTLVTLRQDQFALEVERARAELLQARSAIGLGPESPLDSVNPENSPPVRERFAEWEDAKADLTRADGLRSGNAITAADYRKFETAVDVAKARYDSSLNAAREKLALVHVRATELALAQQNLDDTVIVAPFDAEIQEKQVAPGRYVRVGDPLLTVVRTNPLRFRGSIPERHALVLNAGQNLSLEIQNVPEPITATISRISPSVDLLSRGLLFEAIISNTDGRLRSGLFAEAEVLIDETSTATVIPTSSLVEFAGVEKVWKVVDGKCVEQMVLSGERRRSGIEILQGLAPGDIIVLDGSQGRAALVKTLKAD